MNIELRPDYYLLNFKTLVEFVTGHYADLITDSEWEFIRRFQNLSGDAAKLFVRLCLRRKDCYFSEQLVYQEISSIENAIAELKDNDFILINPMLDGLDLLSTLTKDELKELFAKGNIKFSLRKELVLDHILELYTIDEIHEIVYKKKVLIFKNKEREVEALLHFFFGNRGAKTEIHIKINCNETKSDRRVRIRVFDRRCVLLFDFSFTEHARF